MLLTDLAYPLAWRSKAAAMAQALLDHESYLVCAHVRLDGDALSSMTAMAHFLAQHNKRFLLYAPMGVPENYEFLPIPVPVYRTLAALPFRPRTLLALDCGEPGRLGEELRGEVSEYSCINIDHHHGPGMGTIANLVLPEASSTTQILATIFHMAQATLSRELAEALALGLITDTGGFRHANASPEVFALAALLEQAGVSIHRLREHLEKNWTAAKMRLWGMMSAAMEFMDGERVAMTTLSMEALEKSGARPEDTEGFVEHLRELRTVEIAVFLREQSPNVCKFSLRSIEELDVHAIAASLGGGGHRNASGGTLAMPLENARRLLVKTVLAARGQADPGKAQI